MATRFQKFRSNNVKLKAKKAEVGRYKVITKNLKRAAKTEAKVARVKARNSMPLEKARMANSLAKHSVWAATAGSIFGRGTTAAENISKTNTASSQQNVTAGLSPTQIGRDDDNEEKDVVDGGGVVY